jgi:dTDP-4-dehydrorhamnose reductase
VKVLVTGYTGQLGFDVIRELKARNIECIGTIRNEFSLTDTEKMQAFVKAYKPDAVIHCAAYMNVNEAEDNKDLCMLVNYSSTKELAKICKEIDAKMIYISTDYVFAGSGEGFYEINNDKEPQNVYGKSKLKGELAIQKILDKYFIIRTSWLFGINGNNFIKYVLSEQKKGNKLRIVNDQIGSQLIQWI